MTRTTTGPIGVDGERVRRLIRVTGVVQGVGYRPFVYVTATGLGLTGWVANDSSGVVIEIEGAAEQIAEFERRLSTRAPPLAIVASVESADIAPCGGAGFVIGESTAVDGQRTLAAFDVGTCVDCLHELSDPADRRYRHPFITCTNCGPRFTIITDLPYDRANTTMAGFPMCADCAREYANPADRRFHAQPIACPNCGPSLESITDGRSVLGEAALTEARALLGGGAIVAIKGLGGYHLACDAMNEQAVSTAVMVRDLAVAESLVELSEPERALLTSPRRPIVLLARRWPSGLPDAVAPGNPDLGVMLAYTPIHHLLLADGSPQVLVMTSGNLGGEPIAYDDADAAVRLAPLVDAWLRHDRPIAVPCDDSVARIVDGAELPIRRSRGYAPLPIALPGNLPFPVPATLAVGADLKATCCLGEGRYAWLSQHVGDMDDYATVAAFGASQRHLEMLTGVHPRVVVADRHPGYQSGSWARRHAGGRPLESVQHHHAHVASVMGEHGLDGRRPVIGVAFDGTGYGTDGAVWGGEILVADYRDFRRAAQLAYVPLAGGDASIYRPYRMALAHLYAAGIDWDDRLPAVQACPPAERLTLARQLRTGFGCVATSSMGRLFDAVASLAGVRHEVDYEAQAAIELEGISRAGFVGPRPAAYAFAIVDDEIIQADAAAVIRSIVADVSAGVTAAVIGARFHCAVADLVVDIAGRIRARTGLDQVVLSGGVFQNALLLSATRRTLQEGDFTVLCPRLLPPNDGGIALGQVLAAASRAVTGG
jgi:hydrogenase maturation protein HypF